MAKRQHARVKSRPTDEAGAPSDWETIGRRELARKAELAKKGPAFTLYAQDRCAPTAIRNWAMDAARMGSPAEKIGTALLDAVAMDMWQRRHGSKIPD